MKLDNKSLALFSLIALLGLISVTSLFYKSFILQDFEILKIEEIEE